MPLRQTDQKSLIEPTMFLFSIAVLRITGVWFINWYFSSIVSAIYQKYKSTGYLYITMVITDRYCYSWAAETPDKYERGLIYLIYTFAESKLKKTNERIFSTHTHRPQWALILHQILTDISRKSLFWNFPIHWLSTLWRAGAYPRTWLNISCRHQMETFVRDTGPLCGEFTSDRWIPRTKVSHAELWCFLWSAPE